MFKRKVQPGEIAVAQKAVEVAKKEVAQAKEELEEVEEQQEEEQQETDGAAKELTEEDIVKALTEERNLLLNHDARISAIEAALFRLKALI